MGKDYTVFVQNMIKETGLPTIAFGTQRALTFMKNNGYPDKKVWLEFFKVRFISNPHFTFPSYQDIQNNLSNPGWLKRWGLAK